MRVQIDPAVLNRQVQDWITESIQRGAVRLARAATGVVFMLPKITVPGYDKKTTCVYHPALGVFKLDKDNFYNYFDVFEPQIVTMTLSGLGFKVVHLDNTVEYYEPRFLNDVLPTQIHEGIYQDILTDRRVKLVPYTRSEFTFDAVKLESVHENVVRYFVNSVNKTDEDGNTQYEQQGMLTDSSLFFSRFVPGFTIRHVGN